MTGRETPDAEGARCATCGDGLPERPPDVGGQPRLFCSSRCRKTAWRRAHGSQPRASSLDAFAVLLREREPSPPARETT